MDKPRIFSFSYMRNIIEGTFDNEDDMYFFSRNFGIGRNVCQVFNKLMTIGEPLMVDDNRLALLISGEVDVTVNLTNYRLKAGTAAFIRRGSIIQINSISPDAKLEGLVFDDEFMNIAVNGRIPQQFIGEQMNYYKFLDADSFRIVDGIMANIWDVVHQENHNRETVQALLAALLHYYNGIMNATATPQSKGTGRERELFEAFLKLVNKYGSHERSLDFYADKLCLTERYIGTVVHKTSGRTAKEWIDLAAVTKAKVMLRHTTKPVAMIADELNFATNSFFCKYFKRLTSMTPGEYRDLIHK